MTKGNMVIPSVRKNIVLADSFTARKSDLSSKSLPSKFIYLYRINNIKEISLSK